MNTTVRIKASEVYKDWHVIDAAGRPLGRVATEVASLLKGKHKPTYEPHLDDGDFVIVINASQVKVSGRKAEQNTYYTHSGYPGGLRARSFAEQMARFPDRVIEQAVWGMLPGGPLGKKMLKHLKVYAGPNHPHQSQIAGSEKAQEARKAATAALSTAARKVARLRPLSVPQVSEAEPAADGGPSPAAVAAKEARARVRKPAAVPEAPAVEVPVAEAPVAEAPAPKTTRRKAVTAETTEATTAEAPPKTTRRKAAPAAETAATDEAAPKTTTRRRSTAKTETSEE